MILEKKLKELREKKGISQLALAKKCGFANAQYVSNWERGVCPAPAIHFLTIAEVLGISSREIVRLRLMDWEAELYREIGRQKRLKND